MSSQPNLDRLAQYQSRLDEMVAARESLRAQREGQKLKLQNRRIHAQAEWIRRAKKMAAEGSGGSSACVDRTATE